MTGELAEVNLDLTNFDTAIERVYDQFAGKLPLWCTTIIYVNLLYEKQSDDEEDDDGDDDDDDDDDGDDDDDVCRPTFTLWSTTCMFLIVQQDYIKTPYLSRI